jgi:hypothetical protein
MTAQTRPEGQATTFTHSEWCVLRALHDRYQQGRDLLTAQELTHLRFMRWLCQTGRLDP